MTNVHISVLVRNAETFQKSWPMAVYSHMDGKSFKVYKMSRQVYEKHYKKVDKVGTVNVPKTTTYVKLIGCLGGEPIKLFVRESQVGKVLAAITGKHDALQQQVVYAYEKVNLSITMRRVRVENVKNSRLQQIVLRSLAALNIAA